MLLVSGRTEPQTLAPMLVVSHSPSLSSFFPDANLDLSLHLISCIMVLGCVYQARAILPLSMCLTPSSLFHYLSQKYTRGVDGEGGIKKGATDKSSYQIPSYLTKDKDWGYVLFSYL